MVVVCVGWLLCFCLLAYIKMDFFVFVFSLLFTPLAGPRGPRGKRWLIGECVFHSVQTIWRTKKLKKAQILRFFHFTFKTSIVDSFKRTSPIYPLYQPSCKSTLFNQNKMPTVSKKPSIIFFTVLWEIYQRDTFLRFSVFYIKKQGLRECLYLVQNNVSSQVCTCNSFLIIQ